MELQKNEHQNNKNINRKQKLKRDRPQGEMDVSWVLPTRQATQQNASPWILCMDVINGYSLWMLLMDSTRIHGYYLSIISMEFSLDVIYPK